MISILMPIYNGIEFINESVMSVINQTYTNWELIIGINGHPPGSDVYLQAKRYEQYSSKIRVYDLVNVKGKSNALNAMLSHANYEYIAILDVDDIWMPNKLECQQYYLYVYDVIGTRCVYIGDMEGCVPNLPVGNIEHFDFKQFNPIINSSALIRKDLCYWKDNGIEDYDLWLRLKYQGKKFYNCGDIAVKHRIHSASAFNAQGNHNKVANLLASYQ